MFVFAESGNPIWFPSLSPLYQALSRSLGWENRKELMNKRKGGTIHTDGLMENADRQPIKLKH